jgi:hypothetical protein
MNKFKLDGMSEEYIESLNDKIYKNSNAYIIGWRQDSMLWPYDLFTYLNCNITLIEIFKVNADAFPKDRYKNVVVINDDVQNFEKYIISNENKNIIYWGEGPEHLSLDVSKSLIEKMKTYFDTIIIHTPYGVYNQGPMYGNIYESHLSTWYEKDYDDLNFKHTKVHGPIRNFDTIIGYYAK